MVPSFVHKKNCSFRSYKFIEGDKKDKKDLPIVLRLVWLHIPEPRLTLF